VSPRDTDRRRNARGVFYTPPHVVRFVLDATLDRLLTERPVPGNALPLRLLDPACGDGAFLVPAYERLLAAHLARYLAPASGGPERWAGEAVPRLFRDADGEWQLTGAERTRILLDHVFGVDVDPAAVRACREHLLDAAAGGARQKRIEHADSPTSLEANVRCGDALLPPEPLFDEDPTAATSDRGRPFDWAHPTEGFGPILAAGGFDAVVGNPPYLNLKRGFLDPDTRRRLEQTYRTAEGQYDAFAPFGELALHLLRPGGWHGFVLPRAVLASESYRTLRELYYAEGVTDLAECGTPFVGAGVEAVVVVVRKGRQPRTTRIAALAPDGTARTLAETPYAAFGGLPNRNFSSRLVPAALAVLRKLDAAPSRLGDAVAVLTRGLECGKRDRAVHRFRPGPGLRPLLRGEDVERYRIADVAVGFDPSASTPRVIKDAAVYDAAPKLLLRRVASTVVAALDEDRRWALNALYCLVPAPGLPVRALLGVLNSAVPGFWLRTVFLSDDRLFPYLRLSQLRRVPLPDLADAPPARLAALEELVDRRLAVAAGQDPAALDRGIDEAVAQLYGLSEKDLRVVTGS
jgi:hypothetical protein